MPTAPRTACANRTCPNLRPCPDHPIVRASRQQRGYDRAHERERERWRPRVERGGVHCRAERCVMPARLILPGQPWDLGHTDDRKAWTGPEHAPCNRSAGGRAAHSR